MAEAVKNSTSHVSDADLAAMGTYLKDLPANSTLHHGKPAPDPTRSWRGAVPGPLRRLCHQATGRGMPGVFPPLAGNDAVLAPDPADILKVVLLDVPAQGKSLPMSAFASQLSDQQVADLANHLRSGWGNGTAANTTAALSARTRAAVR